MRLLLCLGFDIAPLWPTFDDVADIVLTDGFVDAVPSDFADLFAGVGTVPRITGDLLRKTLGDGI